MKLGTMRTKPSGQIADHRLLLGSVAATFRLTQENLREICCHNHGLPAWPGVHLSKTRDLLGKAHTPPGGFAPVPNP